MLFFRWSTIRNIPSTFPSGTIDFR